MNSIASRVDRHFGVNLCSSPDCEIGILFVGDYNGYDNIMRGHYRISRGNMLLIACR